MKIWYGVKTQITHFRFFPISPLIFATVQKFALDDLRDQQILIPTCEWGWAVVVPLLGETLEVDDSPGMVWWYVMYLNLNFPFKRNLMENQSFGTFRIMYLCTRIIIICKPEFSVDADATQLIVFWAVVSAAGRIWRHG